MALTDGLILIAAASLLNLFIVILAWAVAHMQAQRLHAGWASFGPLLWIAVTVWLLSAHAWNLDLWHRFWPMIVAPVGMTITALTFIRYIQRHRAI